MSYADVFRSDPPPFSPPLLLSLLVHGGLLLLPFAWQSPPTAPIRTLAVTLLAPAEVAPPHSPTAPPPLAPRPTPLPAATPAPAPAPTAMPNTSTATPPRASIAPPTTEAVAASREITPPAPVPVRSEPAPLPPASASDPMLLDEYGRNLSALLARHQVYPRLAALRGWQGEVRVSLRVARKGNLIAAEIVQSSGYEVLDRQALALIQATPLPPLPMGDGDVRLVVPIHFRLNGGNG